MSGTPTPLRLFGRPAVLLAVACLAGAQPAAARLRTEAHYVMGTILRVTAQVDSDDTRRALRFCFTEARRLDKIFSRFDPNSELSRLNRSQAREFPVGDDLAALTRRALRLRRMTAGAFDITIGRWTDHLQSAAPPHLEPGAAVSVRQTPSGARLRRPPGTRLDFDGIAKGYAVDRCVQRLRESGVHLAFVDFGQSSQYGLGGGPGGDGWEVWVRGLSGDAMLGRLLLRDAALSVSAALREDEDGRLQPHIRDPRTGRLVNSRAVAVVIAASATDAEALSTATIVWGARRKNPLAPVARGAIPGVIAAIYADAGRVRSWRADRVGFRPQSLVPARGAVP